MFDSLIRLGFQVEFHSHARAILEMDFPDAVAELEAILSNIAIPIEEIVGSGGGEAMGTQRLRRALHAEGWHKVNFNVKKIINGVERESISHEIDHVKEFPAGKIAFETEWNNKDPFFDRDLENFKRLHADGAISVGFILTRGEALNDSLPGFVERYAVENKLGSVADLLEIGLSPTKRQRSEIERKTLRSGSFTAAWSKFFCQDKFATSTTHWKNLERRVTRGVGNPCPLALIGIPASAITFGTVDPAKAIEEAEKLAEDEASATGTPDAEG